MPHGAHQIQKKWYDRTACIREFTPGEEVLVLLLTASRHFLAQWQGPYSVVCRVGKVNCKVDMHHWQKCKQVFYTNNAQKIPSTRNNRLLLGRGWEEGTCM